MAVVVYLETENGNFKKSALEVSSYGRKLADETKTNLCGITFNSADPFKIQKYGVEKLINIKMKPYWSIGQQELKEEKT